jgi:hypothetical protein
MHIPSLKIEEDIEFPKVITVKQLPRSLKTEQLGILRALPQFHQDTNLDKECSQVIYKPCTTTWMT